MVEGTQAPDALSSLAARSPTPPRGRKRKQGQDSPSTSVPSFGNGGLWPNSSLGTPPSHLPTSPLNSIGPASSTERPQKRVKFDKPDTSRLAIREISPRSPSKQPRQLPPSRELTSTKSILKPCDLSISPVLKPRTPFDHENIAECLLQELSAMSRRSRLDAYMTLTEALKAYNGTPNRESLASKVHLLLPFVLRDLSASLPGTESVDSGLVIQALKLLSISSWQTPISDELAMSVEIVLVEKAIEALESGSQFPKALVIQYTRFLGDLLARRKFSRKTLTHERTIRLIRALGIVTDHVKGNGIVGERLVVYRRLLQQAHLLMVKSVKDWLKNVLVAMLSNFKEIRSRAIVLGTEAGLSIGHLPQATDAVLGIFDRDDEGDLATIFANRLDEMRTNEDECRYVPQIWSVITLFFRNSQYSFQKWRHFNLWLRILQKCFNSNNPAVNFQAHLAWNKLVFVINPSEDTDPETIETLQSPITRQLERRSHGKPAKDATTFALSSLCNLLYYSLRPGSSFRQLDLYWNAYVNPIFEKYLFKSKVYFKYACSILSMLFDTSKVRTWDMNRANEVTGLFKPEDLPRLDERWVRSRCGMIVDSLFPALRTGPWSLNATSPGPFERIWINFLGAIKVASSKEIKISNDLMDCVTVFLEFYQRIWRIGKSALVEEEEMGDNHFINGLEFLIASTISNLGPLCFTEKSIFRNSNGAFELITSRTDHSQGQSYPGIIYVFQLFIHPPREVDISGSSYYRSLERVLKMCCEKRGFRKTQIELLQDCLQILPTGSQDSSALDHYTCLWQIIADLTTDLTRHHFRDIERQEDSTLGNDCLGFVKILQWPCQQGRMDHFQSWRTLLDALTDSVEGVSGIGEVTLGIIEPIAEVLGSADLPLGILSRLSLRLLDSSEYTDNARSIEAAHKRLWGLQSQSFPSSQTLCQLSLLVNKVLKRSYDQLNLEIFGEVERIICGLTSIWERKPLAVFNGFIGPLQDSLSIWIEDADRWLTRGLDGTQRPFGSIQTLWEQILCCLEKSIPHDDELLQRFEPLIRSGFSSSDYLIMSFTVSFWNRTFGRQDSISYPPNLLLVILRVRHEEVVNLPALPQGFEEQVRFDHQVPVDDENAETSGTSTTLAKSSRKGKRRQYPVIETSNDRLLRSHNSIELPGTGRRLRRTSERVSKSM